MNCLVTKTGDISECSGISHERACEIRFKTDLSEFIRGGVRVCDKARFETLAVEHRKPLTAKQKRIINRFLKEEDYFCVVNNFETKTQIHRPIRKI